MLMLYSVFFVPFSNEFSGDNFHSLTDVAGMIDDWGSNDPAVNASA
jgi:hypothetical protein